MSSILGGVYSTENTEEETGVKTHFWIKFKFDQTEYSLSKYISFQNKKNFGTPPFVEYSWNKYDYV